MDVSIIIPTFQCEKFISRAIRSTLDQNFPKQNYQVIVVNDGSTDNTGIILRSFKKNVIVVTHETNRGLAAARNSGLKIAKGRFVIFLDADDYFHSEIVRTAHLFLSLNSEIDAVAFDYYYINEKEEHVAKVSAIENPIACGIMFRVDQLIDIGLYDESFLVREEEDLRLRFERKYSILNIPLPLYRYRKHDNNITNNLKNMEIFNLRLKKKHEGR